MAKLDKILFLLATLNKSLHMLLRSEGSEKTGLKPELLIFRSSVILPHCMAFLCGK